LFDTLKNTTMKIKHMLCGMLLITVSCSPLFAQEAAKMKKPTAEEKAWIAYATPGAMHEMMSKSVGVWKEDVIMWAIPGGEATKSTATCVNRMIMGGRYLEGRARGSFNGMPFEGLSTTAYDNARKIYQATWIDNMGTGIMVTEGHYNEVNRVLEMKGTTVDPVSGTQMAVKQNLKFIDDNTQMMEMYMTLNGKEFKSMEIRLTRSEKDAMPDMKSEKPEAPSKLQSVPPSPPEKKGN